MNIGGSILLLVLAHATSNIFYFMPGLLLMGFGIGVMLTSSVNVVQSAFPEKDQGEISGLSRSVSNLGSSLGTALVGSVLVSTRVVGNAHFALALIVMTVIGGIGLIAALFIPDLSHSKHALIQQGGGRQEGNHNSGEQADGHEQQRQHGPEAPHVGDAQGQQQE